VRELNPKPKTLTLNRAPNREVLDNTGLDLQVKCLDDGNEITLDRGFLRPAPKVGTWIKGVYEKDYFLKEYLDGEYAVLYSAKAVKKLAAEQRKVCVL
jgi:hypothetical protein